MAFPPPGCPKARDARQRATSADGGAITFDTGGAQAHHRHRRSYDLAAINCRFGLISHNVLSDIKSWCRWFDSAPGHQLFHGLSWKQLSSFSLLANVMANNDATSGHEQGQRLHVIAATVPVGAGQPGAVARGPFGAVGVLEAEDQRPAALRAPGRSLAPRPHRDRACRDRPAAS